MQNSGQKGGAEGVVKPNREFKIDKHNTEKEKVGSKRAASGNSS